MNHPENIPSNERMQKQISEAEIAAQAYQLDAHGISTAAERQANYEGTLKNEDAIRYIGALLLSTEKNTEKE